MVVYMVSCSNQCESNMVAAAVTWWKWLANNASHLMLCGVVWVVDYAVDSRLGDFLAGLEHVGHCVMASLSPPRWLPIIRPEKCLRTGSWREWSFLQPSEIAWHLIARAQFRHSTNGLLKD